MEKVGVVLASVTLAVGLLFFGSYTSTTDVNEAQAQTAHASPNIIFILTDDQPESTLRYMPNLQSRLKGEGRIFNNAFNVYPLCCPSRAIIQRGQYAHNTGIFGNEPNHGGGYEIFDQLDREQSTMATWIHDSDYYTGYFGKYINGFSGPARMGRLGDAYRWLRPDGGGHGLHDRRANRRSDSREGHAVRSRKDTAGTTLLHADRLPRPARPQRLGAPVRRTIRREEGASHAELRRGQREGQAALHKGRQASTGSAEEPTGRQSVPRTF